MTGAPLKIVYSTLGKILEIVPCNFNVVGVAGNVSTVLVIVQVLRRLIGGISLWTADICSVYVQRLSDSCFASCCELVKQALA